MSRPSSSWRSATVIGPERAFLRGDERRDQILDCALEVFASKGFHDTSIANICARAGIARGTLYQYFKDKRDVLAALVDRIVSRIIDAVRQWRYTPTLLNGRAVPVIITVTVNFTLQ